MRALIDAGLNGSPELTLWDLPAEAAGLLPGDKVGVQVKESQTALKCLNYWPEPQDGFVTLSVSSAGVDKLGLTLTPALAACLMDNNLSQGTLLVRFNDRCTVNGELTVNCDLSELAAQKAAAPEPEAPKAAAAPEAPAAPAAPAPAPTPNKKSGLPLAAILGILLAALILAALVVWFFFLRSPAVETSASPAEAPQPAAEQVSEPQPEAPAVSAPEPEAPEVSQPAPQAPEASAPEPETEEAGVLTEVTGSPAGASVPEPAPTAADTPASACRLNNGLTDAQQLQQCLNAQPTDAHFLSLAKEAAAAERCDLAARIFLSRGRQSGGEIALTYAKFLDPNNDARSACFKKDAAEAAYWYQKVLGSDAANAEARAALNALGQTGGVK